MSNQSGISTSEQLAAEFPDFINSSDFAAILAIDHAKENVNLQHRVQGTFSDLRSHLESANEARYLALRLPNNSELAFVLYMPDTAPISFKMKYASSHATVFRELGGSSVFKTTIFWTDIQEVSLEGLKAHEAHETAPAPLTEEEEQLQQAKEQEIVQGTSGSSVANQSTLSVNAKLTPEAEEKLKNLDNNTALLLNVSSDGLETIDVLETVSVDNLASYFKTNGCPCYIVLKLENKVGFVFSCPRSTSIKQRMLFASTRIAFFNYLRELINIDGTIETFDAAADLILENLREELGIKSGLGESEGVSSSGNNRLRFQKPRPPKRR